MNRLAERHLIGAFLLRLNVHNVWQAPQRQPLMRRSEEFHAVDAGSLCDDAGHGRVLKKRAFQVVEVD